MFFFLFFFDFFFVFCFRLRSDIVLLHHCPLTIIVSETVLQVLPFFFQKIKSEEEISKFFRLFFFSSQSIIQKKIFMDENQNKNICLRCVCVFFYIVAHRLRRHGRILSVLETVVCLLGQVEVLHQCLTDDEKKGGRLKKG